MSALCSPEISVDFDAPETSDFPNNVTFVHFGKDVPDESGGIISNPEYEQTYLERIVALRNEVLDLTSNEEGLNLDRIDSYREQMGAPRKAIRFLSPKDFAYAVRDLDSSGESLGNYRHDIDVVLVKRDPVLEELNGPEITESFAIHEIAHSSAMNHMMRMSKSIVAGNTTISVARRRIGFTIEHATNPDVCRGLALEEAYAEYERGQFVLNQLDRPYGFVEGATEVTARETYSDIPGQYLYTVKDEEGEIKPAIITRCVSGAIVLEALVKRDPSLFPALRDSRKSVTGLQAVAKQINAQVPNLYQNIMKIDLGSPNLWLHQAVVAVNLLDETL